MSKAQRRMAIVALKVSANRADHKANDYRDARWCGGAEAWARTEERRAAACRAAAIELATSSERKDGEG